MFVDSSDSWTVSVDSQPTTLNNTVYNEHHNLSANSESDNRESLLSDPHFPINEYEYQKRYLSHYPHSEYKCQRQDHRQDQRQDQRQEQHQLQDQHQISANSLLQGPFLLEDVVAQPSDQQQYNQNDIQADIEFDRIHSSDSQRLQIPQKYQHQQVQPNIPLKTTLQGVDIVASAIVAAPTYGSENFVNNIHDYKTSNVVSIISADPLVDFEDFMTTVKDEEDVTPFENDDVEIGSSFPWSHTKTKLQIEDSMYVPGPRRLSLVERTSTYSGQPEYFGFRKEFNIEIDLPNSSKFASISSSHSPSIDDSYTGLDHQSTHNRASVKDWDAYWKEKSDAEKHFLRRLSYLPVEININGKILHECSICKKSFIYKSECDLHAINVHLALEYSCLNCADVYSSRSTLLCHLRKCDTSIKQMGLQKAPALQESYNIEGKNEFWKSYCSSKSTEAARSLSSLGYTSVMVPSHGNSEAMRACSLCNKKFKFKSRCDKHALLTHSGVKHCCFFCGKKYSFMNNFQTHLWKCSKRSKASKMEIEEQDLGDRLNLEGNETRVHQFGLGARSLSPSSLSSTSSFSTIVNVDIGVSAQDISTSDSNEWNDAEVDESSDSAHNKIDKQQDSKFLLPIIANDPNIPRKDIKRMIAETLAKNGYECIIKQEVMGGDVRDRYFCSICDKPFNCRGECNRHAANVHTGVRYQCPECPKTTSCPGSLRRHMDYYHDSETRKQCPNCNKLFASVVNIEKHIKTSCKGVPNVNAFLVSDLD